MGAAVHKTGNNGSNQKWVLKMGVPSGKQESLEIHFSFTGWRSIFLKGTFYRTYGL